LPDASITTINPNRTELNMINSDGMSTTDSDKDKPAATESAVEEIEAGFRRVAQPSSSGDEREQGSEANEADRESSLTRRAVLKAGWAIPVILAVGLPSTVLAGATSPSVCHDHKPKGHSHLWPKKKHWPDTDKKKHWSHRGEKKHWPDIGKKKQWPDVGDKKHWPDIGKKKQWPDIGEKKQWPDVGEKKQWPDIGKKKEPYQHNRWWF
jgi:hypothetical protein